MVTSKRMVATYAGSTPPGSAGISPGVASTGALISMPASIAETPSDGSLTGAPFSVVVLALYEVLAGMASWKMTSIASSVPVLRTVMV